MTDPFEPIEPTADEIATQEVNSLIAFSKLFVEETAIKVKNTFDMVWNNPKVTPQKMWEKIGVRGGAMLQMHGALQDFLIAHKLDYQPLVPPAFTVAEDGTVTVND